MQDRLLSPFPARCWPKTFHAAFIRNIRRKGKIGQDGGEAEVSQLVPLQLPTTIPPLLQRKRWREEIYYRTEESSSIVVVVIAARQAVRPTSSNQQLGQTFRPISSSNQLLANYFSIHSQHSKKEGRQGMIELKLRYYYQYHHNYPPQLLQMKRWGEERREEEPQKTQSHSHSHTLKKIQQKIMIDVMGWLLPPHSSGTRPAHQCTKNGQLTWRIVK